MISKTINFIYSPTTIWQLAKPSLLNLVNNFLFFGIEVNMFFLIINFGTMHGSKLVLKAINWVEV
jgi:hypothetical protein